jgi:hypothetical protein
MTDKITWKAIEDRCKAAALEMLPEMPKENTFEAWEAFDSALESAADDARDSAWQEVDSWDWAIYTWCGMEIVRALDSHELSQAESQWAEYNGEKAPDGVYEYASQVAYFALVERLESAIQNAAEELRELAAAQMENLEPAD